MRVSIDATPLLLRSAGVKNYTYYLVQHLRKLAGEESVLTFPVNARIGELNHEKSMVGGVATAAGIARLHLTNYSGLPLLDWFGPRVDVFHASQQLRNAPRRTRLTATIHDVTCWLMPETHSPANVAAAKKFAEAVLRRADGLIAVSEHTRADAVRMLGLAPERIEVVHPGVAESYFRVTAEDARLAREKYSLRRPYVLFVGTVEPRKNLPRLLEAYEGLAPSTREEYELVIVGPVGWADAETVERVRSGPPGVRFLGYVPESDLAGLTAGAAAFAYPSLYEGFGFPVVQAMAAGVPVLTSNVSSMPEVAGDAGLLVDPLSVGEIRAGLERLLNSASLRGRLGTNGLVRAQRFRWEASAAKCLHFFERIAGA